VVNFWHDRTGSMLVEYTVVFPLFIAVTLGTVDVAYMLFEWALATKAAYVGARTAVVSNPVAQNITNNADLYTTTPQNPGFLCFDPATGLQNGNCPSTGTVVCTSSACSPTTFGFDSTAFTGVFNPMQRVFPRLQTANVTITYQTIDNDTSGFASAGYVLRPGGLPMTVTVSISGMTHQFFFISPILRFFGGAISATPPIPPFSTRMQSEDMFTN
jgi:Flp pilus assembly protein TadG